MTTRKRLVQVLAVFGMLSALGFTAKPAAAATPRRCTEMCAENCAAQCDISCLTMGCGLDTCLGVNGLYYPATIECV